MPDARIPHNPSEDEPAEVVPDETTPEGHAAPAVKAPSEQAPTSAKPDAGRGEGGAPTRAPGEPAEATAAPAPRPAPSAEELATRHRVTSKDGPGSPGGLGLLGRARNVE